MGCPRFVCFMMGDNADTLVLAPYHKKDFHSHRVSQSVYNGKGGLELSSFPLCQMLAAEHGWDINKSYRVPGNLRKKDGVLMVAFNLQMASAIEQ